MRLEKLLACILAMMSMGIECVGAEGPRFIGADDTKGSSHAVVVENVPLIHTSQLFPRDAMGQTLAPDDAKTQVTALLDHLATAIEEAGGQPDHIVKLNVYFAKLDVATAIDSALAQRFIGPNKPAVSYVVTRLPYEGCLVGMDAVAIAKTLSDPRVTYKPMPGSQVAQTAVMPKGSHIYVAGQAEKGATLAEATRLTLESLRKTLHFLGRQESDIVQLKSFLSPMTNIADAQREIAAFFGKGPVPPTVWVEWQSPLIEIELVAWGGEKSSGPAVEFITPPGMTASPVYSRVARTNSDRLIYVSGLYAREPTDSAGEVIDIFEQLTSALKESGSDLKHLVKATYYCSDNGTSTKLNELRPRYYDPTRPPAASKALVANVGRAQRGLTVDMIAVPDERRAESGERRAR